MDKDKLNLYQKVAMIKGEMAKAKFPKTGYNKFTKFNYFQLDDFEPVLEKLCSDYGIVTFFNFSPDSASMIVVNSDAPDQSISVMSPVAITEKTGNAMQDIGSMQTYARRYLFMSFFGITESDTLDAVLDNDGDNNAEAKSVQNKPSVNSKPQQKDSAEPKPQQKDDEFKAAWKKVLNHFGYDTKKARESNDNKDALSKAKALVYQRYGKDSITALSKEQLSDLENFISKGPEDFVSDEIPA